MTGLLVNDYSQRNPPSLGEAMTGLLGNWGSNIEQGLLSALPVLAENDPYKIGQQLLREGAGVGGIAWHGSPHKYLKPDLSKIGTGEGAQAYGHGFYSAEARGVAEDYQKYVKDMEAITGYNDRMTDIVRQKDSLESIKFDWGNNTKDIQSKIDSLSKDYQTTMASRNAKVNDPGHLYKMNIPDETIDKMLDWDKPLFQQSDQVKRILDNGSDPELIQKKIDALQSSLQKFDGDDDLLGLFTGTVKTPPINQKIYKEIERLTNEKLKAENLINRLAEFRKRDRDTRAYRQGSLKGKDFYNHLGGGEAASEYLNSLGIPGIKYLDGMSRAAGQGSRNFVSFTPDHIEMLERNGVPMKGLLD